MQRSGLQTRIVANIQQNQIVFNTALSEIETVYDGAQQVSTQVLSDALEKPHGSIPIDTGFAHNPFLTVTTKVKYQNNGNTMGLPNTSRLRDHSSRGKNGAGIEKFQIISDATSPNRISSNQIVGLTIKTPDQ